MARGALSPVFEGGTANEVSVIGESSLVRKRRVELLRAFAHSVLNAARLPVPPLPHL